MEFTLQEKQVILDAIALRQQNMSDEHLSKTDSILVAIGSPILKLSPNQKSLLRGCVKEFVIYPNEKLLGMSDYDVFQAKKELQTTFEFVDTGLRVLRKLKDEDYENKRLFQSVTEKIQRFNNIKTIYYSLSGDKVYKAGVVIDGKKGLRIYVANADYSKFEVVPLNRDQFMYEGTTAEIISRIKAYEKNNKHEENHKRLLAILELASSN